MLRPSAWLGMLADAFNQWQVGSWRRMPLFSDFAFMAGRDVLAITVIDADGMTLLDARSVGPVHHRALRIWMLSA